jgi:hypothetical protein
VLHHNPPALPFLSRLELVHLGSWWPQHRANGLELLGAPRARQPTLPPHLLVTANTALPGIPYLLPDASVMLFTFVGRCVAGVAASTTTALLLLLQWQRLRSR